MEFSISRTVLCTTLLLAAWQAAGQPADPKPAFDAVSIKASQAGDPVKGPGGASISFSSGGASLQNSTIRDIVATAYRVRDYQITGPSMLESDRYDIVAKTAGPANEEQQRQMLQTLLADRFHLTLHHETKDLAVYALTSGKSPKFSRSKQEAESNLKIVGGNMLFLNYTIAKLAAFLSVRGDRPVLDETGLEGPYDFTVQIADPDTASPAQIKQAFGKARSDGSLPGIVASQLGLKLEARKGPAEVLVIDHAERASEN
jgi:uncharacterized protein (TIGR03435 family)